MNLYLVLDFESENDISKFKNISLNDLKIVNENNEVICDRENVLSDQTRKILGDKLIENDSHHMKSLIYMYTDAFPISKSLDISFSEITLYTKNKRNVINYDTHLQIDLSEKFINRKNIYYASKENTVKKAIITETGFYAIIETNNIDGLKINLLDEHGNIYNCYSHPLLSYNESNNLEYMVIANFNNSDNEILKLVISDNEIELIKDN